MGHSPDPPQLIPLKNLRITRRKAHLEIRPGWLVLRLPWYFGRNLWQVPIGEVHVVDMSSRYATVKRSTDLHPDPVTVPFLTTASHLARPTLMLLFTTPQPIPELRLKPEAFANLADDRHPEPGTGSMIDGVQLVAKNPAEAAHRLVAAGAHQAHDSRQWLREHRRHATDPVERTIMRKRRSRLRTVWITSQVIFWVFCLPSFVAAHTLSLDDDFPLWLLWTLIGINVVSALLMRPLDRRTHRSGRRH
ncbi:hypothetical protein [Actinomadura sp. 9N407]|uniref:hypothetical protein n=1 Tax=Actinomadura sp. 9N407 TaxID=3375154 RepID=UPI00378D41B8